MACLCLALVRPAVAGEIEIAAFGDSLVHGFGLNQGDGLVPQLNRWLAERDAGATVSNAGVSGDTSAGGLARIDWTLSTDPDALILALGSNDLLRGTAPEVSRRNLDAIMARITQAGIPVLLVGQEAPLNYGIEYKQQFEAVFPEVATLYDALYYPRIFTALERGLSREKARELYMQEDGIHPNAAGVTLIVSDLGPWILRLIDTARAGF